MTYRKEGYVCITRSPREPIYSPTSTQWGQLLQKKKDKNPHCLYILRLMNKIRFESLPFNSLENEDFPQKVVTFSEGHFESKNYEFEKKVVTF